MRKWLARILPMTCVTSCLFVDKVSGRSVGLYRDINGVVWMAEGRWSPMFRVKSLVDY